MFYTSKELGRPSERPLLDSLSPDGDAHPETLFAPAATGLVWLDGRHHPILTTMMLAGPRLVRVYGFGPQNAIFLSCSHCVGAVFVDLESEVMCEKCKTAGAALEPNTCRHFGKVAGSHRNWRSWVLKFWVIEMKAIRERQSFF